MCENQNLRKGFISCLSHVCLTVSQKYIYEMYIIGIILDLWFNYIVYRNKNEIHYLRFSTNYYK